MPFPADPGRAPHIAVLKERFFADGAADGERKSDSRPCSPGSDDSFSAEEARDEDYESVKKYVAGFDEACRALADAAEKLDLEEMAALLDAGVDPLSRRHSRRMPTAHVVAGGGLTDNADRSARRLAALHLLQCYGAFELAAATTEALVVALHSGADPSIVAFLLWAGADVRSRSGVPWNPLMHLARPDVVPILLSAGVDVDDAICSFTPLAVQVRDESVPSAVVGALLAAGAAPDGARLLEAPPLFQALRHRSPHYGLEDVVSQLLEAGAAPTLCISLAHDEDSSSLALACAKLETAETSELAAWMRVVEMLARSEAWQRRRHLLLAVRGRYHDCPLAADAAALAGAVAGVAATAEAGVAVCDGGICGGTPAPHEADPAIGDGISCCSCDVRTSA